MGNTFMSGCSDTAPATSRSGPRDATRRAWIWLAIFAVIRVCYYVYFEWANLAHFFEDEDPLLDGAILLLFSIASLILFIKSILRHQLRPALIYVALFIIIFGSTRYGPEIDLTAKAYFFSTYPEMCPEGHPEPGYRIFLCYKYWDSHSREALVLNPGDEMAVRSKDWPEGIRRALLDRGQPGLPITEVDECFIRKTKQLVSHIYWVSDDCGPPN